MFLKIHKTFKMLVKPGMVLDILKNDTIIPQKLSAH